MNYLTCTTTTTGRIETATPVAGATAHGMKTNAQYVLTATEVPYGYRLVTTDDMAKLNKKKANDSLYYFSRKTGAWKRPPLKSDWQFDNVYCIKKGYKEGPTVDVKVTIDGRTASIKDLTDAQIRELRTK